MRISQTTGKTAAVFAVLFICIGLVYWGSFSVPFQFDDETNIVQNLLLRSPELIGRMFLENYDRFFGYLTFAVGVWTHGLSPPGFHLANLIIHWGASCLVYCLTWQLLNTKNHPLYPGEPKRSNEASFFIAASAAIIFATHPIQTQSVTYIVQRFTSLSTLLYLAALVFYLRGRGEETYTKSFYAFSLIFAFIASFVKQIAFTIPISILLIEYLFFTSNSRSPRAPQCIPGASNTTGARGEGATRARYIAPFFMVAALIPIAMVIFKSFGLNENAVLKSHGVAPDFPTYLWTQVSGFTLNFKLILLATAQNLDHDIVLQHTPFSFDVLSSLLVVVALLAIAFLSKRRHPLIAFGILFFFCALSIETLVPLPDLFFEHRLYLPMTGVAMVFSYSMWKVISGIGLRLGNEFLGVKTFVPLIIATSIGLGFLSIQRNKIWETGVSLWGDVVAKSPDKVRGHINLSKAYSVEGMDYGGAKRELEIAGRLEPGRVETWIDLSRYQTYFGEHSLAIDSAKNAFELSPKDSMVALALERALTRGGRSTEAISILNSSLANTPNDPVVLYGLARAYYAAGDYKNALLSARSALSIAPGFGAALIELTESSLALNDLPRAIEAGKQAVESTGNSAAALFPLAIALVKSGDFPNAEVYFKTALSFSNSGLEPVKYFDYAKRFSQADAPQFAIETLFLAQAFCLKIKPNCLELQDINSEISRLDAKLRP